MISRERVGCKVKVSSMMCPSDYEVWIGNTSTIRVCVFFCLIFCWKLKLCDFKIGGSKSWADQNRGTKTVIKPNRFYNSCFCLDANWQPLTIINYHFDHRRPPLHHLLPYDHQYVHRQLPLCPPPTTTDHHSINLQSLIRLPLRPTTPTTLTTIGHHSYHR